MKGALCFVAGFFLGGVLCWGGMADRPPSVPVEPCACRLDDRDIRGLLDELRAVCESLPSAISSGGGVVDREEVGQDSVVPDLINKLIVDALNDLKADIRSEMGRHFALQEARIIDRSMPTQWGSVAQIYAEPHARRVSEMLHLPISEVVRRLGPPTRTRATEDGSWWIYENKEVIAGRVQLKVSDAVVTEVQCY